MTTPSQPQTLLVPMDVRAFCVGEVDVDGSGGTYGTKSFAQIAADFSQLPWTGPKPSHESFNADHGPSVSDKCLAQPFQPDDDPLQEGIHLHWNLPAALTSGVVDKSAGNSGKSAAATTPALDFPAVPNRWLVARIDSNQEQPTATVEAWVIESDRLWDQSDPSSGQPVTDVDLDQNHESRAVLTEMSDPSHSYDQFPNKPFQALGQVFDYGSWQEKSGGTYLQKLTALGYGDPAYAASYRHCRNVFGFHDLLKNTGATTLSYLVVGWYSDPAQDPLSTVAYPTDASYQEKLETIQKTYDWSFTADPSKPFPTQTLCCGIVHNVAWDKSTVYVKQPSFSPEVAVGNTAVEALSAYLANQPDLKKQKDPEDILKALQLGLLARLSEPGGQTLLDETAHRSDFGSTRAGTLYVVQRKDAAGQPAVRTPMQINADLLSAAKSVRMPLPEQIASSLNALNQAQANVERVQLEIDSLRGQVFADWHKYMNLAYPPTPLPPQPPPPIDADDARNFLKAEIAKLSGKDNWLTELQGLLSNLETAKKSLVAELGEDYELVTVPAPRYWHANDPVVMLAGKGVTRLSRQGGPGLLNCRLGNQMVKAVKTGSATGSDLPQLPKSPNTSYPQQLAALLAEAFLVVLYKDKKPSAFDGTLPDLTGFVDWGTENPWIPMFLQWQADLDPILAIKDTDTAYPVDFVTAHFDFDESDNPIDLVAKKEPPDNWQPAYKGSILLRSRATASLQGRIGNFLKQYPDDPHHDVLSAIEVWLGSHQLPLMAQALSGFNQALIMRHQVLQLPVNDTLAISKGVNVYNFQHQAVPPAVGEENRSASLPNTCYNPLRAGFLKISDLRLVDAFGQMTELDNPSVDRAGSLVPSQASDPNVLALNPRLSQPSRLLFRWLSADDDQVEMNSHPASSPICGWILFNHLDDALMIYDAAGNALGSLNVRGPLWQGAPGDNATYEQPIKTVLQNANPHLKAFALGVYEKNSDGNTPYLQDLLAAMDMTLTNVNPPSSKQQQGLSVLIGRPLALVRSSLELDLQGLPAIDQSWDAFQDAVEAFKQKKHLGPRSDAAFTGVQLPVRVGDLNKMNDGLIGYFVTGAKGDSEAAYQAFYAAAVAGTQHTGNGVEAPGFGNLRVLPGPRKFLTDPGKPPPPAAPATSPPYVSTTLYLSMLVDPRAPVHATTGFQPVKAIDIPPNMYADALRRMAITFLTAPVLSSAAKLVIPTPGESGYSWSWISRGLPATTPPDSGQDDGWHTTGEIAEPNPRATFTYPPQQVREGWLQLQKAKTDND